MTILDEIAAKTKERIAEKKAKLPLVKVRSQAEELLCFTSQPKTSHAFGSNEKLARNSGFPFEQALRKPGISMICEVKKASPSKGLIAPQFPYLQIAKEYEMAGASAISCLTEPFYFQGQDVYLQEIAKQVSIPVLRKDFTVDPYMIYEAKLLGASAVLLICAILDDSELKEYLAIAKDLGLSALVEAHTAKEVERALSCKAAIIGVNNRDLKTFHVDVNTSIKLREMVPRDIVYVSESGVQTADDLAQLYKNGTDAVLIGEMLMRAEDKRGMLESLKSGCGKEKS